MQWRDDITLCLRGLRLLRACELGLLPHDVSRGSDAFLTDLTSAACAGSYGQKIWDSQMNTARRNGQRSDLRSKIALNVIQDSD